MSDHSSLPATRPALHPPPRERRSAAPIPMPVPFCMCSDGETQRQLPVLRLTASLVRVAAMHPPALGAQLSIALYPPAGDPVGPLNARVVAVHLHPGDPRRCAFDLLPMAGPEERARLSELIDGLEATDFLWGRRGRIKDLDSMPVTSGFERRAVPRVPMAVAVRLHIADEVRRARLLDLSMTGALLDLAEEAREGQIAFASRVEVELPEPSEERLRVAGHVVRMEGWHGVRRLAVRLERTDKATAHRLERILLRALCET